MRARQTLAPFLDRSDGCSDRCSDDRAGVRTGRRRGLATGAALLLAWLVVAAPAARADEHDPKRAAHPVRIAAYVLHPIGVMLDYLIVRPAHWVVEREPFRTLFGHEG